jgi:putative ABC transport system ATP-binding protein
MDPFIWTEDVRKIYNPGQPDELTALDGVSVAVGRGDAAILQGPSGSGKTSLLSLVGCMARPTAGRVVVDGRDVAKLPERFLTEVRRRTFGVLDNVLLPLYPTGLPDREMRRRAHALLERLGLAGRLHARVGRLSGGEQQRVAIARALINEPAVIIADEPTAHLDHALADELLGILAELHRGGKTVIIATHDPRVVQHSMVQRTISMRDGRVTGVTGP